MKKTTQGMLVTFALMASSVCYGQAAGQATYGAKCANCHGASGEADKPVAKMLKIKPASDPDIKKLTAVQMFDAVKNGKGKMQPFSGKLTDDEIKASVAYYRTFVK